ncbi:MAG TPA: antitoxin VbhA family protein [Nakamurella sp.]
MTRSTRRRLAAEQRAASVAEATHSAALDGLSISPASLDDAAEYIRGDIDIDETGRRIRGRYGVA